MKIACFAIKALLLLGAMLLLVATIGSTVLFSFLHLGFLSQAMGQTAETLIQGEVLPDSVRQLTVFAGSVVEINGQRELKCEKMTFVSVRLKGLASPIMFYLSDEGYPGFDIKLVSGHIFLKLSSQKLELPDKQEPKIYHRLLQLKQVRER